MYEGAAFYILKKARQDVPPCDTKTYRVIRGVAGKEHTFAVHLNMALLRRDYRTRQQAVAMARRVERLKQQP